MTVEEPPKFSPEEKEAFERAWPNIVRSLQEIAECGSLEKWLVKVRSEHIEPRIVKDT